MEDKTATRPTLAIVLDLQSEADVVERVVGRRTDVATGERPGSQMIELEPRHSL